VSEDVCSLKTIGRAIIVGVVGAMIVAGGSSSARHALALESGRNVGCRSDKAQLVQPKNRAGAAPSSFAKIFVFYVFCLRSAVFC